MKCFKLGAKPPGFESQPCAKSFCAKSGCCYFLRWDRVFEKLTVCQLRTIIVSVLLRIRSISSGLSLFRFYDTRCTFLLPIQSFNAYVLQRVREFVKVCHVFLRLSVFNIMSRLKRTNTSTQNCYCIEKFHVSKSLPRSHEPSFKFKSSAHLLRFTRNIRLCRHRDFGADIDKREISAWLALLWRYAPDWGFPTFLRSRTTWALRTVNAYHFFRPTDLNESCLFRRIIRIEITMNDHN